MIAGETLDQRCTRLFFEPSDISEHLTWLGKYASLCDDVVEFGVRGGVSTSWLLNARPKRLTSIDINHCSVVDELMPLAPPTDFRFIRADTRELPPIACDLLFIDTLHTFDQLWAELRRHAGSVRKWILLHDTTTFGEHGEGGGVGLWPAVEEFLDSCGRRWRLGHRWTNQNGLTLLART